MKIEGKLMANYLINHTYAVEPRFKSLDTKAWVSILVSSTLCTVTHGYARGVSCPESMERGHGNTTFGPSQTPLYVSLL